MHITITCVHMNQDQEYKTEIITTWGTNDNTRIFNAYSKFQFTAEYFELTGHQLELQNRNVKFKTKTEYDRTPVADIKAHKILFQHSADNYQNRNVFG